MTCQHQFILIEQVRRVPRSQSSTMIPIGSVWKDEYGAKSGCPLCGEIRIMWSNGDIETIIKRKDNEAKGKDN